MIFFLKEIEDFLIKFPYHKNIFIIALKYIIFKKKTKMFNRTKVIICQTFMAHLDTHNFLYDLCMTFFLCRNNVAFDHGKNFENFLSKYTSTYMYIDINNH